ncbi:hypothetical protein PoB_000341400 [Plakobranchus ocellatus]|uniref:Uncharacterized protein n=1 Tax=Plakobranchus ocellatus TaxID=259542 RepID=A0AAV3Y3W5_9GAST|nr:hypothetical protein PoB_000341400 [Plakobranchus ocellatus]
MQYKQRIEEGIEVRKTKATGGRTYKLVDVNLVITRRSDPQHYPRPPSGQGASGGARARDKRVPADLKADSLATEPPTHHLVDEDLKSTHGIRDF